jgi:hypothetical protein
LFTEVEIRIEVALKNNRVERVDHKVSMQYYDISFIRVLETFADDPVLTLPEQKKTSTWYASKFSRGILMLQNKLSSFASGQQFQYQQTPPTVTPSMWCDSR